MANPHENRKVKNRLKISFSNSAGFYFRHLALLQLLIYNKRTKLVQSLCDFRFKYQSYVSSRWTFYEKRVERQKSDILILFQWWDNMYVLFQWCIFLHILISMASSSQQWASVMWFKQISSVTVWVSNMPSTIQLILWPFWKVWWHPRPRVPGAQWRCCCRCRSEWRGLGFPAWSGPGPNTSS